MNLLLLLSALLSALTGAASTVREPTAAHAVRAAAAATAAAVTSATVAAARPIQSPPRLVRVATAPAQTTPAFRPAIALYASRRRE